jgi:predicted O-methyltransferase YrrM
LMSQELWTAVDRYITDLLVPSDAVLVRSLEASAEAGMPAISVSPNQGKLLMMFAQMIGARRILEIGTLGGYSTIWLARGMDANGRLITLEADARHAGVAHANIARAGLSDIVEVRLGEALDTLRLVEGPFDLIFIDADKVNYPEYLAWAVKLSRTGTVIVADNVVRKGAVIDGESGDPSVQGVRRFHEALAADPRLSATAIQTVGSKGYDGFTIARVL